MKKLLITSTIVFLLTLLTIILWPQNTPKIDKYPRIGMNINLLTLDYGDSIQPLTETNLIEGLIYFLLLVDRSTDNTKVTVLSSLSQLHPLDLDNSGLIDLMDPTYYRLYIAWYNKKTHAVKYHAIHRSGIRAIEFDEHNGKLISATILMGSALKRLIKPIPVTIVYPKRIKFEHAETPKTPKKH